MSMTEIEERKEGRGKGARWGEMGSEVGVVLFFMAVVAPVLLDGRAGILDAPVIAHVCRDVPWDKPVRVIDIMGFGNQARPLQVLAFVPCFFTHQARYYHIFQNGLLLVLTCVVVMKIITRLAGGGGMAAVGASAVLLTPAFTPNYFTLWTMEPYMLFGVMGLVYVWVRLLGEKVVGKGAWWWYNGLGVIFAAYAIGVKEVGVMAFVVCMIAAALLARDNRISVDEVIARAWPALAAATLAFSAVVVKFMLIERAYDAGGTGGYRVSVAVLARSLERFGTYLVDAAPYAWLGLPVWVWLARYARRGSVGAEARNALRRALAGALVFYVIALGMIAVYVPWQVFDARYLLIGDSGLVLAAWLVMRGLWVVARELRSVVGRGAAWCGAWVLGVLIGAHALYALAVGPLSEGIVRHRFAVAYDEMFKYVTNATGREGTVYFLMDWRFPEARENTVHSLDVFYGRGDIKARFPTNAVEMVEPGLVVVSEYAFPVNYTRMPVHYEAREVFYQQMQPRLRLREVTNMVWETPVWYAKEGYNVTQYDSEWGLPAIWRLRSGEYRFGWRIYWYEGGGLQAARSAAFAALGRGCKRSKAARPCRGAALQVRPFRGLQVRRPLAACKRPTGASARLRRAASSPRWGGACSGAERRGRDAQHRRTRFDFSI